MAILKRWNEEPPLTYRIGMLNNWQDPPQGFIGPEFGYESIHNEEDDEDINPNNQHSDFEETIREVENYLEPNKAIARLPFIEYTELELSEFPNVDLLNDEQISRLVIAINRLLTSYNFMLPHSTISPRLIYPILLKKLNDKCSITRNGFIGIEFCSYDPNYCPFGIERCECTDEKKQ